MVKRFEKIPKRREDLAHFQAILTYVVTSLWLLVKSHSDDDISQEGLNVLNFLVCLHEYSKGVFDW